MAFKSGFSPKAQKTPKIGGGGNALMNMMLAQSMLSEKQNVMNQAGQQQQQWAQGQLGSGAMPTKAVGESVTYESPNARMFTADAQNQLTRIKQLKIVTKNMEALAMNLPTDFMQAAKGTLGATKAWGRFGTEAHKTYLDAMPAAAAGVYRAITGDNRLSDMDAAARAKPLFWDPMESERSREGKFSFLNFMMDEAEKNLDPTIPQNSIDSMLRFQTFVTNSTKKFKQGQQPSSVNPTNGGVLPKKVDVPVYQLGQQVVAGNKTYKVVGLDDPNDPDLELIQ